MPTDRLGVSLAVTRQVSTRDLVHLAQLADELGYHSIWIPETWGTDAVSLLAVLAVSTGRIRLASGVFNVFSRSAALLAQTAATISDLSGGRFILGLGSSGPTVIENWHGIPFHHPLQRTRSYVAAIRLALSGQQVDLDTPDVHLAGFTLANPPRTHVPIYLAALGPRNLRLCGEIADGWLPIFAPRDHLGPSLAALHNAASASNRDPAGIDVAAYLPCAVGADSDRTLRSQLAYYIGGMGAYYAAYLSQLGFATSVQSIRDLWQRGERGSAAAAVDASLLAACTLGLDPSQAAARLIEYRRQGVGLPILVPPHGLSVDEIGEMLVRMAPQL